MSFKNLTDQCCICREYKAFLQNISMSFCALYFEQYVSVSICITVMQPYLITGLINWTKKWAAPGGHGPLTPLSTY